MLFDSYRKLLDFEVKPFNFDKLNSSTMKLAAFISAVDVIDESVINGAIKGVAWDILTSDIDKVKSSRSEVISSSDFEIPDDVSKKYERVLNKYNEQLSKRKELISEKTNEINGYVKFAAYSDSENFESKVRPAYNYINTWSSDFFGDTDKALQEYKEFHNALNELSQLMVKSEQDIAKLAKLISAINAINVDSIYGELNGAAWDALSSKIEKAKSTRSEVIGTSYFMIPDHVSEKYDGILKKFADMVSKRKKLVTEKTNDVNGYVKLADKTDNENFEKTVKPSYDAIKEWESEFFGNSEKATQEYKDFQKAWHELTMLMIKADQAIKASGDRVLYINNLIDKVLGMIVSIYNFNECENLVSEINLKYAALSDKEKKLVKRYDEYVSYLPRLKDEIKHKKAKYRRHRRFSSFKYAISDFFDTVKDKLADFFDAFKDAFISFAHSAWVVLLLAGLCVGIFFITRQNWFFTAPKWLLNHDIAFYHWHAWDWKLMNMGFDWDVFLIHLVAGVLGLVVDLFIYVLQAIFWLLCAVIWPLRWAISRLLGCLFYALAYGLPVVVGAGGVTGVVFFGKGKSRIVNIVLCAIVVVMTYLCIYVFF